NYILPYRNYDEPVEPGTRKKFMERYSWVFDSLNANVPLRNVVNSITESYHHRNLLTLRSLYPIPLSSSQYEKSKMGICQDGVTFLVNLFRSLGLETFDDCIPHWRNHVNCGDTCIRLTYGDEVVYFEDRVGEVYKDDSMPKVYRRTFSTNLLEGRDLCLYEDVISDYKDAIDIEVPILFNGHLGKDETPIISVFDQKENWYKVAYGEVNGNKIVFKKMGDNVLYLAGYKTPNGQLKAVNYPFFLSPNKEINYFKPKEEVYDSIVLVRKMGIMAVRDKLWNANKQTWLDHLNGGEFQGSNSPTFENYTILGQINNLNSYQ